jgi:hypothetical protein
MVANRTRSLCHAAALALVGWYLMVPPRVCPPGVGPQNPFDSRPCGRDPNAPLNNWVVSDYFDSADDCDDRLKAIKRSFAPDVSRLAAPGVALPSMPSSIIDEEYQCVYDGDPRLAK